MNKYGFIIILLLSSCTMKCRGNGCEYHSCVYHNYSKLPPCNGYNYLPADKGEYIEKEFVVNDYQQFIWNQ
jgi:hypothetical protein